VSHRGAHRIRGRGARVAPIAAWALIALALSACASAPSSPPVSPVAITDYKMVAGRWQGEVTGLASKRDEGDSVQLTIGEDGTYDFGVYRTIGVFSGKGKFVIQDGKLVGQGERGRATFALYEGGGQRFLRSEGAVAAGQPVSAELRPAR